MTRAAEQRDDVEALLRQTIRGDLALSSDLDHVWVGLRARIAGPCAGETSASSAAPRRPRCDSET